MKRTPYPALTATVACGSINNVPSSALFWSAAICCGNDQPPARDAVEHGVLLGERERMLAQAEGVAEDRDLRGLGPARERGRHHHRRGHQPIGVLVMLVDGNAVEAELGG